MSSDDVSQVRPSQKWRWAAVALAAVLGLAIGAGAYAWRVQQERAAAVASRPDIGGPFELVDQRGRTVDESLLRGKWTAVFFGYTYCPDVCPATLQTLQAASQRLGPAAEDLQVVFISVDPARDTPEALRSYLSSFNIPGGVHGLTGTPEQVDAAAKAWKAYYRRGQGPEYLVDHFTGVYLMDPEGRFSRVVTHDLDPQRLAAQIRAAMAEGPTRA